MIFQKNRNKLIEKAWGFEQDIITEQNFEYAPITFQLQIMQNKVYTHLYA